jgi:hypothetical protein
MHFCPIWPRPDAAIDTPYGSAALRQRGDKQRQRLPTVTDEILCGRRKFRSSLTKFRIQEQGIVTETGATARCPQNLAPPQPLRNQR